jgi:hypothetical protein
VPSSRNSSSASCFRPASMRNCMIVDFVAYICSPSLRFRHNNYTTFVTHLQSSSCNSLLTNFPNFINLTTRG